MHDKIAVGWIDPGQVNGHFALSLASSVADMEYFGCLDQLFRMPTSLPARARNVIVQTFLDESDADWLWFVDADMVFDKGHPMKLLETALDLDVKIVSGLAFMFLDHTQPVPSYFLWGDGKFFPTDTLYIPYNVVPEVPTKVAATGMASVLIHREVFEAMKPPRHPEYRWFDQIEIGDVMSGEDTQFFVRAGELGYATILDPNAETWHMKTVGIGKQDWARHHELAGTAL